MFDWPEPTHTSPMRMSSKLDLVLAANGHAVGLAVGLHGRKDHLPVALGVGLGGGGRLVELHRDLFVGGGPAPDRQRPVALQHHVVPITLGSVTSARAWGTADDATSREMKNDARRQALLHGGPLLWAGCSRGGMAGGHVDSIVISARRYVNRPRNRNRNHSWRSLARHAKRGAPARALRSALAGASG